MIGRTISHYRVVRKIGHGGMGHVYLAENTRLDLKVALKFLSPERVGDAQALKRLRIEARAAAKLQHENIGRIHDLDSADGQHFLVLEYIDGQTLREHLKRGPLPAAEAVRIGQALAAGLAHAHQHGILHRDLKPENVMLTAAGGVKLLDFGLAKQERASGGQDSTQSLSVTDAGAVVGTPAYMSPEQVRAAELDQRSDIFALGAVLHEMLSGQRAFHGDTVADIRSAILTKMPVDLAAPEFNTPPALAQLVSCCLEKDIGRRFASAHDVRIGLQLAMATFPSDPTVGLQRNGRYRRMRPPLAVIVLAAVVVTATAVAVLRDRGSNAPTAIPTFTQVTFRRGLVRSARFAPDGATVVYSAAWQGNPLEIFAQRLGTADARSLGLRGAQLVGVVGGEVAVILADGTLARVPLEGGTPREVLKGVDSADWSGDGSQFAVVRKFEDNNRLEFPIGKLVLESTSMERFKYPRLSPRGDQIAFIAHPNGEGDEAGSVIVVDPAGQKRVLSDGWLRVAGLAWHPDGSEIWFTATKVSLVRALYAVTLLGKVREVMRIAGDMDLHDISRDGRVLLTHGQERAEMRGRMAGDSAERDLSWLDGTSLPVLSPDGTRIVFQEWGAGGGALSSTYFWRMDGSAPVRLGDGWPWAVSPDWNWVLGGRGLGAQTKLRLVPIGAGESKSVPLGSIQVCSSAGWHPDGKRLLIRGNEAGRPQRLFTLELPDGVPRPFTPEGIRAFGTVSQDGRYATARPPGPDAPYVLYPIDGGEPRAIPGLTLEDEPIAWSEDSRSLFVTNGRGIVARVARLDLSSGLRHPWLELTPPDRAGIIRIAVVNLTPNGRYYTYWYYRDLYDLFVVGGLVSARTTSRS